MSCVDLKDYFLRELPDPQSRQVEAHLRGCPACREELDRLRITEAAMFALRDEEIPQRIAFVSDKVFEPSPLRRWWAAFWGSAPRLGFASAAMLSTAILVFSLTRPAPIQPGVSAPPATVAASAPAADVQAQIQAAVDKAVSESEARQATRTQKLVSDFLERQREDNARLARAADLIQYMERQNNTLAMDLGGYRRGSGAGGPQ